jgi:hypothetical protein
MRCINEITGIGNAKPFKYPIPKFQTAENITPSSPNFKIFNPPFENFLDQPMKRHI